MLTVSNVRSGAEDVRAGVWMVWRSEVRSRGTLESVMSIVLARYSPSPRPLAAAAHDEDFDEEQGEKLREDIEDEEDVIANVCAKEREG